MGLKRGLKTANFAAHSALPAHKSQQLSLNQGKIFIQPSLIFATETKSFRDSTAVDGRLVFLFPLQLCQLVQRVLGGRVAAKAAP